MPILLRPLILTATGLLLPSCGLLPVPTPRRVPGVVTQVKLVDATTSQPLAASSVGLETLRVDTGWLRGTLSHVYLNDSRWPELRFGEPIAVRPAGAGVWVPVKTTRTALVYPWGLGPLGWAQYSDIRIRLDARADGYRNLLLFYSPSVCHTPEKFRTQLSSESQRDLIQMDDDGLLTIRLPRKSG